MNDELPHWDVLDGQSVREIIGEDVFKNSYGDDKKIGGDIHSTVDVNPASSTYGQVHSTMRIPGSTDFHC